MNILVLCTGNSARSILLEAIFDTQAKGRLTVQSAGSKPTGVVNPNSIALLKRKGIDGSSYSSKSWDVFAGEAASPMDLVITVCGNARDETCPYWPGQPIRAHWGVEDPANVVGSQDIINAAFEKAYDILEQRAQAFLALEFENMTREDVQAAVNSIATVGMAE
jgi:protein-tyrosine-phosphatase